MPRTRTGRKDDEDALLLPLDLLLPLLLLIVLNDEGEALLSLQLKCPLYIWRVVSPTDILPITIMLTDILLHHDNVTLACDDGLSLTNVTLARDDGPSLTGTDDKGCRLLSQTIHTFSESCSCVYGAELRLCCVRY